MISLLSPCEAKSNHSFSCFIPPNSCEELAEPIRQEVNSKNFVQNLASKDSIKYSLVKFVSLII